MAKRIISEEFKRLQKLAGIISETQTNTPDWDGLSDQLLKLEAYLKNNLNDSDNKDFASKVVGFNLVFTNYLKKKDLYESQSNEVDEYEITADDKIEGRPCVDFKPKELKSNDIIYRKLVDVHNYHSNWYKDKTKIPGGEGLTSYDKPKEFEVVSNDGKILKLKEK